MFWALPPLLPPTPGVLYRCTNCIAPSVSKCFNKKNSSNMEWRLQQHNSITRKGRSHKGGLGARMHESWFCYLALRWLIALSTHKKTTQQYEHTEFGFSRRSTRSLAGYGDCLLAATSIGVLIAKFTAATLGLAGVSGDYACNSKQ
jgi:hypothetical protein